MIRRTTTIGVLALALVGTGAVAGEQNDPADQAIRHSLSAIFGPESALEVKPTPVPGIREVLVEGQVIYVTEDGRYVLQGTLMDLKERRNLTEDSRGKVRAVAISGLDEKDMIVFAPSGEVKHTITVFTDPDCPYCRKLHSEVPQLNAMGIKVRYLAFPRAGIPSPTYDKTVSIWCAADRQAAMNDAKNGVEVAAATCENPVADELQLGIKLGISGTPTIITDTGRTFPGYMPAKDLAAALDGGDS